MLRRQCPPPGRLPQARALCRANARCACWMPRPARLTRRRHLQPRRGTCATPVRRQRPRWRRQHLAPRTHNLVGRRWSRTTFLLSTCDALIPICYHHHHHFDRAMSPPPPPSMFCSTLDYRYCVPHYWCHLPLSHTDTHHHCHATADVGSHPGPATTSFAPDQTRRHHPAVIDHPVPPAACLATS